MTTAKKEILEQLQKQILAMEGFKNEPITKGDGFGLGALENSFPNGIFPRGCIQEFLTTNPEQAAATEGFMAGLMAKLMETGNPCLWISRNRKLFPPALQSF
ncbi:MAG: Error-prone repair protein ImuA, partial [Pedobacter sp.]